jgi:hypothetical protein
MNDSQTEINNKFFDACKAGDLNQVSYLLTSPDLSLHADINYIYESSFLENALMAATENPEIVYYLLTCPELKQAGVKYANIHPCDVDGGSVLTYATHNLELFKFLLFYKDEDGKTIINKKNSITQYTKCLNDSAFRGNMEVLEYLLTSPDMAKLGIKPAKHKAINRAFIYASSLCQTKTMEFLLSSYTIEKNNLQYANIHSDDDHALIEACKQGHLDTATFLLTSPLLKEHSNLHAKNDKAIIEACTSGNIELVKFLLTSPQLLECNHTFPDIHAQNDKAFIDICKIYSTRYKPMIDFLIFEIHIEKTPAIIAFLDSPDMEDHKAKINQLFLNRELFYDLNENLPNITLNKKKNKI